MIIRAAAPADRTEIRSVLTSAFPSAAEADLVEQLRADGDAVIELVAEDGGRVVGHILFSPMQAPFRALALAPLAVAPERQRSGIGSALVTAGNALARGGGWHGVFVLGDPAYYGRFGYSLTAAAQFDCRYSGPHFMLLPLADPLPAESGKVRYAPAFEALG